MKRILSFFLALALLLPGMPVSGRAEETAIDHQTLTVTADPGLPDSEYLFSVHATQVLYDLPRINKSVQAGSRLTGDTKKIYDAMVPVLRQIADGNRKETGISVGQAFKFGGKTYEPDVKVSFTGKSITGNDLRLLLTALLSDLPYDLYWYDKTSGCATEIFAGKTLLYVKLKFSVAQNYRAGTYAVDTAKTSAASKAAANASHIVTCYAEATDYNKLMGYADAICDLADYDQSAADNGNYAKNNDPWQLIHIFDGDPETKAVCEGYAKAYLYLCDLSDFTGKVRCYTVTGSVNGAAHMWNIVRMGEHSYMMDVTNTDGSNRGNALLLGGCTGSIAKGYQAARLTYRYDANTMNLWGTGPRSILHMSKTPAAPLKHQNHSHSYGSWETVVSPTPTRIGVRSRACTACGYVDSQCSPTGSLEAPTLTLSANTATGKPKLSWNAVEGADLYRVYRSASKSGSYSRIKSTSSTAYTDTAAEAGTNYYYKVVAADTVSGTTSAASNILNRVCDLPKPTVTITGSSASGKPIVKWETVEGAAKYYIYRAAEDGSFSHVKTAVSARSYEDTAAEAGVSYSYRVKAVHENTSANSAYSATVTRVCDLPRPVVSVKLNSEGAPLISWELIDGAKNYRIYRCETKDGEYTYLGSTSSFRYADRTAETGVKYYYKVKAIHAVSDANSAYSSVKYITAE